MRDYAEGGPAGTGEWTGLGLEMPSRAVQIDSDSHGHSGQSYHDDANSLEVPGQTTHRYKTMPSVQPWIM